MATKRRVRNRTARRRTSTTSMWGKSGGRKGRRSENLYPKRRRVADTGISVRDVLALANAVYDRVEWISAKAAAAARDTPTWELIYEMHQDYDAFKVFQAAHSGFRVAEADEAVADEILAWASESTKSVDDYRRSLAIALSDDEATGDTFATVCSAVPAFRRERDRHVSEAHVGEVGQREIFTLTLKRVRPVPNRFGTSYRLKFYDTDGNELVWFSSRPPESLGLEIERECAIRATIRRHDEFLGSKQTVISRGRLVAAAAA